jgi:formylglycine-generating enzyme required for sulfatase activity
MEREASSGKGNHPVVNVNYYDAVAFCEWLSRKDGKTYRLPTDHEWSCAVGIGDQESANATPFSKGEIADEFPWGSSFPPSSDAGNFGFPGDGYEKTAPVGSFRPNHLGIYDLGGNVSEWCQDLYRPDEKYRVMRGSNWNSDDKYDFFLSSSRGGIPPDSRSGLDGFRCVVEHSSR